MCTESIETVLPRPSYACQRARPLWKPQCTKRGATHDQIQWINSSVALDGLALSESIGRFSRPVSLRISPLSENLRILRTIETKFVDSLKDLTLGAGSIRRSATDLTISSNSEVLSGSRRQMRWSIRLIRPKSRTSESGMWQTWDGCRKSDVRLQESRRNGAGGRLDPNQGG